MRKIKRGGASTSQKRETCVRTEWVESEEEGDRRGSAGQKALKKYRPHRGPGKEK